MATVEDVLAELREAMKDPNMPREKFLDLEARIISIQRYQQ